MANFVPADFEQYVQDAVVAGRYANSEAAYLEAFNLLRERDRKVQEFRAMIKEGADALARGDFVEYDDEGLDKLRDEIACEHDQEIETQRSRAS